MAGTTIGTWTVEAVVHILLAQWSHETWQTVALKVIYAIHTGSSIQTWRQRTIVIVLLTSLATVSRSTHTSVAIELIYAASPCKQHTYLELDNHVHCIVLYQVIPLIWTCMVNEYS